MKHYLWHNHQLFCHRRHGNGHFCHLLNKGLWKPVLGKNLDPRRHCDSKFCRGPVLCNPKRNPVLGEDSSSTTGKTGMSASSMVCLTLRHEQHVRLLRSVLRNALLLLLALHHLQNREADSCPTQSSRFCSTVRCQIWSWLEVIDNLTLSAHLLRTSLPREYHMAPPYRQTAVALGSSGTSFTSPTARTSTTFNCSKARCWILSRNTNSSTSSP